MYQENDEKSIKLKGSEVGRDYSLKGLEKQIENIHFPKEYKPSDEFMKLANTFNKEVAEMTSKQTTTPTESISLNNNISSALGNENFEDDEPIKRKKKRNKGFDSGMTL